MTMPGFVVRRTGTQKTKSLLCGALFLCGLVLFGVGEWKSYPLLAELKMPDKGAHMNRAINVIQCTLLGRPGLRGSTGYLDVPEIWKGACLICFQCCSSCSTGE